jgi:hypothetical protein
MLATIVYVLCASTSFACALLLVRGYRRSGARLLLWSSLCFLGLAMQNSLLLVDLVLVPDVDLSLFRDASGLVGVCILLFALILEGE